MDKIETFRYEKKITLNDRTKLLDCTNMLIIFMENDAQTKGEEVEYFQLRLMDCEKSMSWRDLKLEWMTSK